jgi:hypothetical protein
MQRFSEDTQCFFWFVRMKQSDSHAIQSLDVVGAYGNRLLTVVDNLIVGRFVFLQ